MKLFLWGLYYIIIKLFSIDFNKNVTFSSKQSLESCLTYEFVQNEIIIQITALVFIIYNLTMFFKKNET